ncbi:MAG: cation transporter [candidate division KSB1 bacterium]|nr:cation transporter [candidate division KSB1 bacterium]MDZ7368833.1 cation transporter [candidate division KSB1 bacterium]MDZ7407409.1 cation transporter [candidate division KSB1 bacterium]
MKKALFGASAILLAAVLGVFLLSGEKTAQSAIVTTEIDIAGMSCQNCADKIDAALTKLHGIQDVEVRLSENKAFVKYDAAAVTVPAIETSITRLGYKVGKTDGAVIDKQGCDEEAGDCCAQKTATKT